MKKRIIATFLLISAVLQGFGQGLLIVQFYANRAYIAQTLCVNKSRPKLKCDGLCQLSKKLKEDNKKEKGNSGDRLDVKIEFSSFLLNYHEYDFTPVQLESRHPVLNSGAPVQRSSSIFHPPAYLS